MQFSSQAQKLLQYAHLAFTTSFLLTKNQSHILSCMLIKDDMLVGKKTTVIDKNDVVKTIYVRVTTERTNALHFW